MNNLEKIKADFYKIKALNFVKSTRVNNIDGGIGNTFEDLLGVVENNLKEADYLGFEIKSQREFNASYISLFSKSPTLPKRSNSYLRETYGEYRDLNHPDKKKLYASVFGHRYSIIYDKYQMKLEIDRENKIMKLLIYDLDNQFLDSVLWTFEALRKASMKMKSLMLVMAEERKINEIREYHFTKAEIYHNFNFENFIAAVEKGFIMFDLRIGVHNSGIIYGKTHDHGSGFRIKQQNFHELYEFFDLLQ